MIPTTILTMVDGVRVVVPDSLDLITPYYGARAFAVDALAQLSNSIPSTIAQA